MTRRLPVLLILSLVAGCSIFGGDDDEPVDPPAELTEFEPTLRVSELWKVKVGKGTENLLLGLGPATDGARVFAGDHEGTVVAVDVTNGKTLWREDTGLRLSGGPGVGRGLVIFGTSDGDVLALDKLDGSQRWRVPVSGEVLATPAIGRDYVLVRTVDGRLRALDVATGEERWNVEQAVPRLTLRGNSAPVIAGELVVAGFDNGRIAAYELSDGDVRWENVVAAPRGRTEIERLADVDAAVHVIDRDIYTASFNGRTANLALESGQILWSQEVPSYRGLATDWVALYVTDDTSHVVALSRASGAVLWTQETLHMRALTTPVPYRSTVAVADFEGYLHWLDAATGALAGRVRVDDAAIVAPPVATGDVLLVLTESGRLAAYVAQPRDAG
jgi:outer membrane protein assembly factor BamB